MNKINDIILGTAQFGSNYGVGTLKGNLYNSNEISNLKLFLTEPENWRKKNE